MMDIYSIFKRVFCGQKRSAPLMVDWYITFSIKEEKEEDELLTITDIEYEDDCALRGSPKENGNYAPASLDNRL
jgi:hypothetical protein